MYTRLQFHEELSNLDVRIIRMGELARRSVTNAVRAYMDGNVVAADQVLADDDAIDDEAVDIEATSLRLLALQQPMARDLRRISSAIKVSYELERVGDHAVEVAKNTRKLVQKCFCSRPLVDIDTMAAATTRMLDESITAFLRHDVALVKQVCTNDDIVDEAYKKHREELLSVAQTDHLLISAASYTLLVVTSIERIADHATNIAERIAFIETGQFRRIAREHRLALAATR